MRRRRKRPRRKAHRRKKKWIQKAIKHPEALTKWFYRNRAKLRRELGYDPITKKGDINDHAIYGTIKLIKEGKLRVRQVTLRRLNLAKTLEKLRKHKK